MQFEIVSPSQSHQKHLTEEKKKKTKKSDDAENATLGSIAFVVDEKGDDAFIIWLCVSKKCNENEVPVNEELMQNWRGCGLGVLLIIVIIKCCAAKNGKCTRPCEGPAKLLMTDHH